MDATHQKQQPDLSVYAIPVEAVPSDDRTGKVVDLSAFTMGEWSHSLHEIDPCPDATDCKYFFCQCFVLAQMESRIGKASYESALRFHIGVYAVMFIFLLVTIALTICVYTHVVDASSTFMMVWVFAAAIVIIVGAIVNMCSIVDTRSEIRKRFQIPEGPFSDCSVMRRRNMRGMRQMALHLKIDQAGIFDRVDTLPPYEG